MQAENYTDRTGVPGDWESKICRPSQVGESEVRAADLQAKDDGLWSWLVAKNWMPAISPRQPYAERTVNRSRGAVPFRIRYGGMARATKRFTRTKKNHIILNLHGSSGQ